MSGMRKTQKLEWVHGVNSNVGGANDKCSTRRFQYAVSGMGKTKKFDAMVTCVDRHSGWIISVPVLMKGLTAGKVAKLLHAQWRIFGVPSVITCDRGAHFVGTWWQSKCNFMGILAAYSHA